MIPDPSKDPRSGSPSSPSGARAPDPAPAVLDPSRGPKKRGLGRGLDALLPSAPPAAPSPVPPAAAPAATEPPGKRTYFRAGIETLYPSPEQPRRKFDEAQLAELADSMKVHGVIVPLVVRPRPEGGGFYLIAGERRWRAAQRAGLHDVPVVVQDVAPQVAFERALVENVQRSDLGPLEEAAAFQRLSDEFGLTQEQIAERIGKDRSTVANAIRLLKLPLAVRQLVEDERLSMGHARALLGLDYPGGESESRPLHLGPAAMERAARTVVERALSVRATEALVKKARTQAEAPRPARGTPPPAPARSATVRDLEERLTRALGGPVVIREDVPGKSGRIEIRYLDLDHLDRLLDRLL